MKGFIALLGGLMPLAAFAHEGYPTADRVEYVLACMQDRQGGYELVHKCSCAIDAIAKKMKYSEYVETNTAARGQSMRGERGNAFRDPEGVKDLGGKFKKAQTAAYKECLLK